jgi:hypothetical protein
MLTGKNFLRSLRPLSWLLFGVILSVPMLLSAQIKVLPNGDVGIGTPTPTTKLDINGGLRWRAATIPGNVVVVDDADGNLITLDIETVLAQAGGIPASNVFYVGRRFQGYANASNPGYTEQLSKAIRGDVTFSYPDPWSARDAAKAAMVANEITDALIYILPGQVYTYGDASNANNGTADFSSTPFEVDKKTTSTTKADINLYHEGIKYYFNKGSGLKNHCSAYPIRLVDVQGETPMKFELFGEGDFYNYYGEWKVWNLEFVQINNPKASFRFSANSVNMQQHLVFYLARAKQFTIDLETATLAGCILVGCTNRTTLDPIVGTFKVKNIFNGEGIFGPYVNNWYLFVVKNAGPAELSFEAENIYTVESAPIFYGNDPTSYNKISVKVKNIEYKKSTLFGYPADPANNCAFLIGDNLPGDLVPVEIGNSYSFHVDNYLGDMPFLYYEGMNKKSGSKNNVFDVYCGNCLTRGVGQQSIGLYKGAGFNDVNPDGSLLKISGHYRTLDGPVIKVLGKTSNVEIDASLSSEYALGLFDAGTIDVNSITFSGVTYPQVPGLVFKAGTNLPNIRKLTLWDKVTKTYTDATPISSANVLNGDITGPLSNAQIVANAVGTPEIANGAVTGTKIAQNGATIGQVLEWNGTAWVPGIDDGLVYTGGTGIGVTGSVISNTGDVSNTNEIQDLTLTGNTLALSSDPTTVNLAPYLDNTDGQNLSLAGNTLSITGGNSIVLPSAPVTSVNNLTGTVALDLSLTGSTLSLTGDATPITLPDASNTNELQTLSVASNLVTLSNTGGSFSIAGAGTNTVNTVGNAITVTGTDITTNEGVLGVNAGTTTTSIITSNSTGANGVTLTAGTGITLTETTSTNGGIITIASAGSGSNWTVTGTDIYRNSNVSVGTTLTTGAKLTVQGTTSSTCLRAKADAVPAFGAIMKGTGTGTGVLYGIDIDASSTGNTINRFRNMDPTLGGANNSIVQVEVGAEGDPMMQYIVTGSGGKTWSMGIDNSDNDKFKIQASTSLGAVTTGLIMQTDGKTGVNGATPLVSLDASFNSDAIALPKGSTANRPAVAAPLIRYNTDFNGVEVKSASIEDQWKRLSCTSTSTFTPGPAAGSGTVSASPTSNDLKGVITVTVTPNSITGVVFSAVFFGAGFTTVPVVVITPGNMQTATDLSKFFISTVTSTGWTLSATGALSNTTYKFYYHAMD